jgi:hypothetical protein
MKKTLVKIAEDIIEMKVEGDTFFGAEEILLYNDDDLTKVTDWHKEGFTVKSLFTPQLYSQIYVGITAIVQSILEKEAARLFPNFSLEKYHRFCENNELHLKVIEQIQKYMPLQNFPVGFEVLDKKISEMCGVPVTCNHPTKEVSRRFYIRIVRPQKKTDNNPPHRDVWLERLRDALNIYLPLAGSNSKSSLPLIPQSHLWKESDIERTVAGAKVNDVVFTVPCVVGSKYGLEMIRPQVLDNEVMVFSPYLIHGGGCNLNEDVTRVSIEIRFWRKP